ncbi:hypothetical protein FH972_022852 [Carpinus fangiana]|uniref:PHD-type domain-containing protein n=1 Tax=Carpinus fangiana TaxID=176857 RepID=A0A5N6KTF6_9ROSI|nr:hypothetical protein FH972_022852 [Carpinus fangiana]
MEAQNSTDELYPIAVLIDELKVGTRAPQGSSTTVLTSSQHDDVLLRLNAIHRLSTIALALGPERTRDELIPFLDGASSIASFHSHSLIADHVSTESVEDEDEVLTALSEELGNFVEYVGGPEYGHVLLSPLENLAAIEEPLVREKAVESLNKICKDLSTSQIEEYFIPLTSRLSKADWFTSKISATGLYEVPYSRASAQSQENLRELFKGLVHDDTPMVRRQAANNMPKFVKTMPPQIVIDEMIPLFQHLAGDDQDSVRLLTVEILIAIAEVVPREQQSSHGTLLTALRSLFEDKSWRVRYMVADRFEKIAKAVDEEVIGRDLVPAFIKLVKDTEAEVRSAIAGQIPGFCTLVEREVLLNDIMPAIEELVTDGSQHVRAALGSQISGLAPILGKEETINHLLPMFLQMLKDEFPDVRLNIISKLEQVNNVIGIEKLSSALLPAIITLAEDKQWRVRLAIIDHVPLLASQLGVRFFDEQLNGLCMSWLGDTVFSIREASTQNLKKLTEVFGVEWANEAIVPKVMNMGQHSNYLYRMTTCFAISTLAPALNLTVIESSILPMLDKLSTDDIPNIRFNVAKSYSVLIDVLKRLPETGTIIDLEKAQKEGKASGLSTSTTGSAKGRELVQDQILPHLERLQNDDDVDVRYFAMTASQRNGSCLPGHRAPTHIAMDEPKISTENTVAADVEAPKVDEAHELPTADGPDDATIKAINDAQNQFGTRVRKPGAFVREETGEPMSKPEQKPLSKKRPKSATSKTNTAGIKKPATKKRRLDSPTTSHRSGTPQSIRKSSKTPAAHSTPFESSDAEESLESDPDDTNLYCICRKPDNHTWMIGCDGGCEDWFHGKCVGMVQADEPLLDKFICPNCEEKEIGVTTWKPMCRRDTCRQPARLKKGAESKYCSDDCGRRFMQAMVAMSGKKNTHDTPKKRRKAHAADHEEEHVDLGPLGGPVRPHELAALVTSTSNLEGFKALGSPPNAADSALPTPPASSVSPADERKNPLETQHDYTSEETTRLAAIAKRKARLRERRALLKDREKFVGLVKAYAASKLEKQQCGFDPRLSWDEANFSQWRQSPAGQAAFERGGLVDEPVDEDAMDVDDSGKDKSKHADLCLKKRCGRHNQWQKLALQDIGQLALLGLQVRVAANVLLVDEDVGHAALLRDALEGVLDGGTVVCVCMLVAALRLVAVSRRLTALHLAQQALRGLAVGAVALGEDGDGIVVDDALGLGLCGGHAGGAGGAREEAAEDGGNGGLE